MKQLLRGLFTRMMVLFLAVVTALSLVPLPAMAAELPTAASKEKGGFIELLVCPMMGAAFIPVQTDEQLKEWVRQNSHVESFQADVLLTNDSNHAVIPARSLYGFYVQATYYVDGNPSPTTKIEVAAHPEKELHKIQKSRAYQSGTGRATVQCVFTGKEQMKAQTWYFTAKVGATASKPEGEKAVVTCTVNIKGAATGGIRYTAVGMQVRGVDTTPIGPQDYLNTQGDPAKRDTPNTTGIYKSIDGIHQSTWKDGRSYPDCYFNINWESSGSSSLATIDNLEGLYSWLATWYIPAIEKQGKSVGAQVTLYGPTQVKCYGNSPGDKYYTLDYTSSNGTGGIFDYVSWGATTKTDFEEMRFTKMLVSTKLVGTIEMRFFDVDDPDTMLGEQKFIKTSPYKRVTNQVEFQYQYENGLDTFMTTSALNAIFGGWREFMAIPPEQSKPRLALFMEHADNVAFSKQAGALITGNSNGMLSSEESAPIIRAIQDTRKEGLDLVRTNDENDYKHYRSLNEVTPPTENFDKDGKNALEGYTFVAGVAEDSVSRYNHWGPAVMTADMPVTQIVTASYDSHSVLNLYYKATGDTKYKVKFSNNGIVDEKYTKTYPGKIGDTITEDKVDISGKPPEWTVDKITNVPLPLVKDENKNIIIVECTSPKMPYKVSYYLDNVLKQTESFNGKAGGTITSVPIYGFSGYTYSRTDGLPMLLTAPGQVVRVYYVAAQQGGGISSNATLYKDSYKTPITKSKSGYGVYGRFKVDGSAFYNKELTFSYAANNSAGNGSVTKTVTVPKYKNIKTTATVSAKDYLLGKVNAGMPQQSSSGGVTYFTLPKNSGSIDRGTVLLS